MHITLVDDEKILTSKVAKKLVNQGYSVDAFLSYQEFMQNRGTSSDLYIIDISLPDGSGFDIIKFLRASDCRAPIIIISGYGDSENIIYGLNIGADDYLTKPFNPEELLARIQALLRRPAVLKLRESYTHGNITLDPNNGRVTVEGTEVYLTHKEYLLLEVFLQHPNMIVSRTNLIEKVWGTGKEFEVSDNTMNATLSKIRKKLGPDFSLETVYNQGYILSPLL